jgi:hypothetical protein
MSPSEERKSQPSDHWVIDPQIAAEEAIKGPQRRRLMPVSPNSLGHRLVQQLPIEARRLPNDCDAAFGALRSRLDNLLPRSRFYTKAKGFASSFSGFWPPLSGRLNAVWAHRDAGGLVHPLHRAARQAAPTYTALRDNVQQSAIVTPDETGWRVGGELRWLWVAAHALRLRDRHLAGDVSEHGLAVARGRLQTRLNAVLDQPSTVPAVRRSRHTSIANGRALQLRVRFHHPGDQLASRASDSPRGRSRMARSVAFLAADSNPGLVSPTVIVSQARTR